MSYLTELVKEYYRVKGKVWPEDADDAVDWAITEIAEVKELTLDRSAQRRGKGWVRNNPEKHPGYPHERLLDELADAMAMIQVAGIVEGADVLDHLTERIIKTITPSDLVDKE